MIPDKVILISLSEGEEFQLLGFNNNLCSDAVLSLPIKNNKFGNWIHAFWVIDHERFDGYNFRMELVRFDAYNHGRRNSN